MTSISTSAPPPPFVSLSNAPAADEAADAKAAPSTSADQASVDIPDADQMMPKLSLTQGADRMLAASGETPFAIMDNRQNVAEMSANKQQLQSGEKFPQISSLTTSPQEEHDEEFRIVITRTNTSQPGSLPLNLDFLSDTRLQSVALALTGNPFGALILADSNQDGVADIFDPNANPNSAPVHYLPPGYFTYGDGKTYMQDSRGRLFMTPEYQAKVNNINIDWFGVARDLGTIAVNAGLGVTSGVRQAILGVASLTIVQADETAPSPRQRGGRE